MKLSQTEFLKFLNKIQKKSDYYYALIERCEYDLDLFSRVFFPHFCINKPNQFHIDYDKISSKQERAYRRAWAAPRGSAKSVKVSLIKPIHDCCYGLERFILLVSNTDPLATAKLKDIRDEVLNNYSLQRVYGLHFEKKKPGETAFLVCTPKFKTYYMAVGRGSQIRGVRFGPHRPSKIICDDMEHSEKVYSELQRNKTSAYFKEDIGKCGDTRTNIEVVGTILHRQGLLASLLNNPTYYSKKYRSIVEFPTRKDLWNEWEKIYMNIMDDNRLEAADEFYEKNKEEMNKGAKVMWEDRENLLYLYKEMIEIGRRSFMKEKQNDPLGADDRVFENIKWYRETSKGFEIEETGEIIDPELLKNSSYGALDPSAGQRKASNAKLGDFSCLITGYKDSKGRIFVHKDWTKRKPPTAQIDAIFDHHDTYNYEKFAVETNMYRELLLPNILAEKKRREAKTGNIIKIPFYDVENTENKEQRIYRLEPKVHHGWILFNRNLSQEAINQLEEFPHADHDDFPDTLEMLWNLCHNRYKAGSLGMSAMNGR